MKKIACVVFELEENETVEDVVAKLEKCNIKVKNIPYNTVVETEDWRVRLKNILNDLGENISTLGYGAMFDIMECVEKNPKYKEHFLVKELYAYVTEKTGRPYSQIERNIRAMIERIFTKNSYEDIKKILGSSAANSSKMDNVNFIATIIDEIF